MVASDRAYNKSPSEAVMISMMNFHLPVLRYRRNKYKASPKSTVKCTFVVQVVNVDRLSRVRGKGTDTCAPKPE